MEIFKMPTLRLKVLNKHSITHIMVKSKETVGNSWTILKVILGHKYHHNHSCAEIHSLPITAKIRNKR